MVDLHVVGGVVLVVAGGLENRVEINRVDAELLEIIEMIDDPLEIAAEVIIGLRSSSPLFDARGIVRRIPVGKPFGKYLIEDRVLHPVGNEWLSLRGGAIERQNNETEEQKNFHGVSGAKL